VKHRKRPLVVEAEQWWPGKDVPGVAWEHDYFAATYEPAGGDAP
jgi:hypothetical protein